MRKRRSGYLPPPASGRPADAANARALIKRLFFDPKRYDLGRVGRYKINQKLGIKGGDSRILTKEDLVAATKYLLRLKKGEGSLDDIDHLGSRASAQWANFWPTNAAWAWPAPNAWSRSA